LREAVLSSVPSSSVVRPKGAPRVYVKPVGMSLAERARVGVRALLASFGAYFVASLLAAVMAAGLPRLGVTRLDATTWGLLTALLVMPLIPIAAFGFKRVWVAAAWIGGAGALLYLLNLGLRAG
jgi:hypothetical protein